MGKSLNAPEPLPWVKRATTMPQLPGRGMAVVASLRGLLTRLRDVSRVDETIDWPESGDRTPVREALHALGPCGLYQVADNVNVRLTQEAVEWLDGDDPEFLIAVFHSRIKFLGEILSVLAEGPRTHEDLRSIAQDQYRCEWSSLDPIRRRTTWLRSLGMVELSSYDNLLIITDDGKKALNRLNVETPESIATSVEVLGASVNLASPSPVVKELLESLDDERLSSRRLTLAYIPKTSDGTAIEGLRILVQRFTPQLSREHFQVFCNRVFGIAESSSNSVLTTLRTLGLVRPISRTEFAATDIAQSWVASGNSLDLIRIAHSRISFVGELLYEIDDFPTASTLAEVAKQRYGFGRIDTVGMRVRLGLLREAELVSDVDHTRHQITKLGVQFRDELPVQRPLTVGGYLSEEPSREQSDERAVLRSDGASIAMTLRELSGKSFEQAAVSAFEFIGIDASPSGSTEESVLLTISVSPRVAARIILEMRSAVGPIGETDVSFDVINERKKRHTADYAAVVASGFSDRVQQLAREHHVVLINSNYLADLVLKHIEAPLAPSELVALFENGGQMELSRFQADAIRLNRVVGSVLSMLRAELEHPDDEVNGFLTYRETYMALRNDSFSLSGSEVKETLNFLSSPLVRGVKSDKDRYYSLEKPTVTAARLRSLADEIERVYRQNHDMGKGSSV